MNKKLIVPLTDLKVGDKIFVKGTVNGTNVAATEISAGFHGGHRADSGPHPQDTTQSQ